MFTNDMSPKHGQPVDGFMKVLIHTKIATGLHLHIMSLEDRSSGVVILTNPETNIIPKQRELLASDTSRLLRGTIWSTDINPAVDNLYLQPIISTFLTADSLAISKLAID